MPLKIQVSGRSDVGMVRPGNEDYLLLDRDNDVFAVFDGMGGHKAGEVASMTAATMVQAAFACFHDELLADPDLNSGLSLPRSGALLLRAIRLGNRAIADRANREPEKAGMGTTVVAAAAEDDFLTIAHVGDSRIYRLDERALTPLTTDHSMVAEFAKREGISEDEAAQLYGKNVITRALGVRESVAVDYRLLKVSPGQVFVMCSDGLCGYAEDIEIFEVANRARKSTDHIVNDLIQMANDRGGPDNVTVIAFEIKEVGESNYNDLEPATLPEESDELLAIEDGWVRRLQDYEAAQTEKTVGPTGSDGSGKSKTWMGLIFAVFVVVAIALIYFLAGSD